MALEAKIRSSLCLGLTLVGFLAVLFSMDLRSNEHFLDVILILINKTTITLQLSDSSVVTAFPVFILRA